MYLEFFYDFIQGKERAGESSRSYLAIKEKASYVGHTAG